MIRDEHKWVKDAIRRIMWPEPSPDLHDRIMARVSYPVAAPQYALSKFKLSAALLTAFLIAFIRDDAKSGNCTRHRFLYACGVLQRRCPTASLPNSRNMKI